MNEINSAVNNSLKDLDFSILDNLVKKLAMDEKNIFGSLSFFEKVQSLLNGDFVLDGTNFFKTILSFLFDGLLSFLPLLATIVVIIILSSIISSIKPSKNEGVSGLIHFVCFSIIVVLLAKISTDFIYMTIETINNIKTIADAIFPILLTLITAMGGLNSSKIYGSSILVLSSAVMSVVSVVLVPLAVLCFVFTVLSNLHSSIKLDKFTNFFQNSFKWILGSVFTIFMGYMALNGLLAASFDGVSIKTAKYAIRSSVPLMGGYLSEGFDVILSTSMLIKNSVGIAGIVALLAVVLVPVSKMLIFNLGLKFVSGICEPICDKRAVNFIEGAANCITLLMACLIAVFFMFVIVCFLIIQTANNF